MASQQDDPLRPTQDKRGFFMLPRFPSESGYYNYGLMDKKPDRGGYQYPHPIMMQAILRVALEWQRIDRRRIGIGNISRADAYDARSTARTRMACKSISGRCEKTGLKSRWFGRIVNTIGPPRQR